MNLYEYLLSGEPSDDSICLVDTEDRVWSYGQLRTAVEHLSGFIEQSTLPADRCAIYAENGMLWIASYLATIRSGRIAVPIPAGASETLLRRIVRSASPKIAFADAPRISPLAAIKRPDMIIVGENEQEDSAIVDTEEAMAFLPTEQPYPVQDADLAALMYTSGSTGEPRAVMVSHHNIASNTASILQYMGLSAADRLLHVLPMSYCFGASLLHTHLRAGACIVLQKHPLYPSEMVARLKEMACTGFAGVPGTYTILLLQPDIAAMSFPHLRYLQQAGGKMPAPIVDQVRRAFPGKLLYVMYGQTEATARLAYLPPEWLDAKPSSIGKAIPGVTLQVLNTDGRPVRPGETGEVVAQGPNITAGYWQDPDETRRVFRNGKLHTGDLATVDEDGYLYITGRARDFLKLGGVRVACAQIEEVIAMFPGVRELAVVSRQDDILGEIVVLFAAHPRGEEVRQQLADFCANRLPFNQRPREIHFMAQLPRNASGKIDHRALQEEVAALINAPLYTDQLQAGKDAMPAPSGTHGIV